LISILKRTRKIEGVTSLGLAPDGFSLAHVVPNGEARPRLQVCQYIPCDDPVKLPDEIASAVRGHGLEGANCVCVLSPDMYGLRQIETPSVDDAELAEAARWSIKDLVEFDVSDAVIDVFPVPERESSDRPRRIYAVAAPRDVVEQTVQHLERAGLNVMAIDIMELALRNISTLVSQDDRGVALMALSAHMGIVIVTRAGLLYLARTIDSDLEEIEQLPAFELSSSTYELGEPKPELSEEAEQILDGVLLEAQRSLDYYEHGLGQDPVSTFVLAPLHFASSALEGHLARNLSIDVKLLDLNVLFDREGLLATPLQARCLPAVGGALRATKAAP
jgi:MSHA biogenesis protein MshI